MGAQVHWLLGYPDKALAIGSEALALAEHVAHPLSVEFVLVFNAMLHVDRGEPELSAQGWFDEAVACLRDALAGGLGARTFRPYGFTRLAEALANQGQHGAAIAAVRQGMEAQEETAATRWGAELHRLEGIALRGLNWPERAEAAFQEALRVARRQQARGDELRVATSLARLWGEQGRRAEAPDLLAPVYGWFTEGFNTADLKGAKTLLDELV